MEEKRGGARTGAGAPKKEVSEQAQAVMRKALRMIYSTEEDEEAQIEFIKKFIQTPRGMQFIAEHTFGKAPQIIEGESKLVVTDLTNVSTQTLLQLEKEMNADKD